MATMQGCNFREAEDGLHETAVLQVQKDSSGLPLSMPPRLSKASSWGGLHGKRWGAWEVTATPRRLTRVP